MKFTHLVFGAFALLLLLPLGLSAQEFSENPDPRGLIYGKPGTTEAMSKSQLTFFGKVTDVRYRLSKEGIPHTFVTYRISQVIHGSVEEKGKHRITLRFIGGPTGDGLYLLPPTMPTFNVGDEDVLFVTDNGESECPLVGCTAGRIRIRHDRVYTNAGQPVIGIEKGRVLAAGKPDPALRVTRYPRPDFDKLYQRKEYRELLMEKKPDADLKALRESYEKNVPKAISLKITHFPGEGEDSSDKDEPRKNVHSPDATDVRENHLDVSDLLGTLSSNARTVKHRLSPAKSLDPEKAFSARIPGPTKPKAIAHPVKPAPIEAPTKAEQEELRMLKQQGFNPVLKPAKQRGG